MTSVPLTMRIIHLPFRHWINNAQRVDDEIPFRQLPGEDRAYYHPDNHELAVLSPQPYSGIIPIVLGIFTGSMIAIQHFLKVQD